MSKNKANKFYKMGLDCFKKGNHEEALKYFNKALNIFPAYPEVLSDKGAVLAKLGRYNEALEALNEALQYNSNLTNAIKNKNYVVRQLKTTKPLKKADSDDSWQVKWTFLINRMKQLIAKKGKKIVLINVEAMKNPQKQFEKYMKTCETVKNQYEAVVSTSLPGEERIFWPNQDVQFYIRDDDEKIHSTGNSKAIQEVLNISDKPITTDSPDMDFWAQDNIIFQLDNFRYVDESRLFDESFTLDLPKLLEKYQYQQAREFGNKKFWYLVKFLFIASYFQNIEGSGTLIGGVPIGLKIKCNCGKIINRRWILKGFLEFPEYDYRHEYYLGISEKCEKCGSIVSIYRDKALDVENFFMPMRIYMNFLKPTWNYDIDNVDLVAAWLDIFKKSSTKDMERIQKLFPEDVIKFGKFVQDMDKRFNK